MPQNYYARNSLEVLSSLSSSEKGLSDAEISRRQEIYGPNVLSAGPGFSSLKILFSQFKNPLTVVLLIAAVLSYVASEKVDAAVIIGAITINVLIGFIQENKAGKALLKLKQMVKRQATVRRDGKEVLVESASLVPGDILVLHPGTICAADARIISCRNLEVNEAILTGESVPVYKNTNPSPIESALGDRLGQVYSGTTISAGYGLAVVTAIATDTELGKISKLVSEADSGITPLQHKLKGLSRFLSYLVTGACVFILAIGLMAGRPFLEMFSSAVAIAVAAIPEGLIAAVTVILALGMRNLVGKKALVRKLLAAETLGSTTVICTDKTGTLTTGKLRLNSIALPERQIILADKIKDHPLALNILNLAGHDLSSGNALDNILRDNLPGNYEEPLASLPFSSENKYAMAIAGKKGSYVAYTKGAGEKIISLCDKVLYNQTAEILSLAHRQELVDYYDSLTGEGLRVIAVAYKPLESLPFALGEEHQDWNKLGGGFILAGFIAFKDTIRPEAVETIRLCRQAGIKPVIVTGDHPLTAQAIAADLNWNVKAYEILTGPALELMSDEDLVAKVKDISIFARVSPEHKLRIVSAWQKNGQVVAMTGDGLNDSPALKAADIGICLGSGTEVAKDTADLVLLDDNFATIVNAVKEGRIIFDNIRKTVVFLIANGFSEMILILGSIIAGMPLAILPTQILWINIVNDGFPSFSMAFEKNSQGIMDRPPFSKSEQIINGEMKTIILGVGLVVDSLIFFLFYYIYHHSASLGWDITYIRSIFFMMLAVKSMTTIFALRSLTLPIYKTKQLSNPYLLGAVLISFGLMLLAVYFPPLANVMHTTAIGISAWYLVIAAALANILMIELVKLYFNHKKHGQKN